MNKRKIISVGIFAVILVVVISISCMSFTQHRNCSVLRAFSAQTSTVLSWLQEQFPEVYSIQSDYADTVNIEAGTVLLIPIEDGDSHIGNAGSAIVVNTDEFPANLQVAPYGAIPTVTANTIHSWDSDILDVRDNYATIFVQYQYGVADENQTITEPMISCTLHVRMIKENDNWMIDSIELVALQPCPTQPTEVEHENATGETSILITDSTRFTTCAQHLVFQPM